MPFLNPYLLNVTTSESSGQSLIGATPPSGTTQRAASFAFVSTPSIFPHIVAQSETTAAMYVVTSESTEVFAKTFLSACHEN